MGRPMLPESFTNYPDHGRSHSRCVIIPAKVGTTAEALEREGHSRFVRAGINSDLTIHVDGISFYLHKLPMLSRSGYLCRLVFRRRTNGETTNDVTVNNLPGDAESMELIVRFCYGLPIDLTATNIVSLYCAAHFLEMNEDLQEGNLISQTEVFLNFAIFSSWKDTFTILRSCEVVPTWANQLQISRKCVESISRKVCIDPQAISCNHSEGLDLNIVNKKGLNNNNNNYNISYAALERWWFEDVSLLKYYHFITVITAIKARGLRSELVDACIVHWVAKCLPKIELEISDNKNDLNNNMVENLIMILPKENGSVTCNFLLRLLKLGLFLCINNEVLKELERRVVMVLENACVDDLLVKNYGNDGVVYDVGLVRMVVETYFAQNPVDRSENPKSDMVVARIIDGYLTKIATDANVGVESFRSLLEALPENSRKCSDGLYRAVDMYLKAHSCVTEKERKRLCTVVEYHKLSLGARLHAIQNDRLPLMAIVHLLLVEQVRTARLILAKDRGYHEIALRAREARKGWIETQKEVAAAKEEMEKMKVQLNELLESHVKLERKLDRGMGDNINH